MTIQTTTVSVFSVLIPQDLVGSSLIGQLKLLPPEMTPFRMSSDAS